MLGEIWTQPTSWLHDDQLDSVMNYNGFGMPVAEWLTGKDMAGNPNSLTPTLLDSWLHGTLGNNNRLSDLSMMNSLDTHDTTCFLTLANDNVNVMLEAVELQMTYIGSPSIFHGDESGMQGGNDPDNRRPFDWNQNDWNDTILNAYQNLISLREQTTAPQDGSFVTLDADNTNDIYAHDRWDAASGVITALNNSTSDHVVTLDASQLALPDGTTLTDQMSGQQYTVSNGQVTIDLAPRTGMVLVGYPGQ